MIEKLLPCKKCKSKQGVSLNSYSFEDKNSFSVDCNICDTKIKSVSSEDKAVNNWNQLNKE